MTERVLVPDAVLRGLAEPAVLDDEATRHLHVLRVEPGERVVLFDGRGYERDATVHLVTRKAVWVTPEGAVREGARADGARVTWLQGYPKGDKLDTIVRQATELGVAVIRPVYTARSVPRAREDRNDARIARWTRIAEEAARQCNRADLPTVLPAVSLDEALAALGDDAGLRVVAWEGSTTPLVDVVRAAPAGSSVVLCGPEGGLDAHEVERCVRAGFAHASLGPRVLRAETVAPALLAVLSALRGDLAGASPTTSSLR